MSSNSIYATTPFGAETESRVRAFQRRNTLVPDGIAGSQELDGS
ncbi:peptidoglycan-binding protein [Ralstonia pseudosolanacearum]|nr:peptidoglycan-binding protein [Ralstonia pseudosolanacearum]